LRAFFVRAEGYTRVSRRIDARATYDGREWAAVRLGDDLVRENKGFLVSRTAGSLQQLYSPKAPYVNSRVRALQDDPKESLRAARDNDRMIGYVQCPVSRIDRLAVGTA
jgi:hypothetical protein